MTLWATAPSRPRLPLVISLCVTIIASYGASHAHGMHSTEVAAAPQVTPIGIAATMPDMWKMASPTICPTVTSAAAPRALHSIRAISRTVPVQDDLWTLRTELALLRRPDLEHPHRAFLLPTAPERRPNSAAPPPSGAMPQPTVATTVRPPCAGCGPGCTGTACLRGWHRDSDTASQYRSTTLLHARLRWKRRPLREDDLWLWRMGRPCLVRLHCIWEHLYPWRRLSTARRHEGVHRSGIPGSTAFFSWVYPPSPG
jgi:hypothetical protein